MSAYRSFETIKNIGVIGTGTIGASWATYFLSRGFKVKAWDPGDGCSGSREKGSSCGRVMEGWTGGFSCSSPV